MRILKIIIISLIIMVSPCIRVHAFNEIPSEFTVSIDGGTEYKVRGIDVSHGNNTYLSLRDIANILKDGGSRFSLYLDKDKWNIQRNGEYEPTGHENQGWTGPAIEKLSGHSLSNILSVDGNESRFYAIAVADPEGFTDVYMMLTDLCMILDMDMKVSSKDNVILYPEKELIFNPFYLEEEGFFQGVNSILVGDATTGEIFYRYRSNESFPIASTTKLMSLAVIMDSLNSGEISLGDQVIISRDAQQISQSSDGFKNFKSGESITVEELLYTMMLSSSNEGSFTAAKHVAGTESNFVERMRGLAGRLGMESARFYNSHGLPIYSETKVPAKLQNNMSTEDMFRLCTYLLEKYPQIKTITSTKSKNIESLGNQEIRNTNLLLYDMPKVTGLKTGTTDKAGCCLVTSLNAFSPEDGEEHDLIVVLLGAESSVDRFRISGIMAMYAEDALEGKAVKEGGMSTLLDNVEGLPATPGGILDLIVKTAMER